MSEDMAVGDNATTEEAKLNGDEAAARAPDEGGPSSEPPSDPAPQTEDSAPPPEDAGPTLPDPQPPQEPVDAAEKPEGPPKGEITNEAIIDIQVDIVKTEPVLEPSSESGPEASEPERGLKRRASAAFSEEGIEVKVFYDGISPDEQFKGFETVDEMDVSVDYSKVLERLEAEVSAAKKSYTPIKVVSALPTPLKASRRPRQDTGKSTGKEDGSRPSSGLSTRSDGEGGLLSEVASSSAPRGGRRATTEMSSPLLRVPLERGWKRELVFRATLDVHQRRNADIYYYTPQGKKLRSTREVAEQLYGTGLTLENFSFFKETLGTNDPEKEIIRDAKMMRKMDSPIQSPAQPVAEGKRTPKPKRPKGSSPDPPASKIRVKSVGSRISGSGTPTPKQNAKKQADNNNTAAWKKPRQPAPPPAPQATPTASQVPPTAAPAAAAVTALLAAREPSTSYGIMNMGTANAPSQPSPPTASPPKSPTPPPPASPPPPSVTVPLPAAPAPRTPPPLQSRPQQALQSPDLKSPRQVVQPCSMTCGRGVPTLSCAACLCLYHPSCVGCVPPAPAHAPFLCANCRKSPTPPSEPPPLIHKSGVAGSVPAPTRRVPAIPVPVPIPVPAKKQDKKGLLLRMKVAGGGPDGERVWAVAKPQPVPVPVAVPKPQPVPVPVPKPQPIPVPKPQAVKPPTARAPAPRPPQVPSPRAVALRPTLPQSMAVINGKRFIIVPRSLIQPGHQ